MSSLISSAKRKHAESRSHPQTDHAAPALATAQSVARDSAPFLAPFAGTIYDYESWGEDAKSRLSAVLVGKLGSEFNLKEKVGSGGLGGVVYTLAKPGMVVKIVLDEYLRFLFNGRVVEHFYSDFISDFRLAETIGNAELGPKVYTFGKCVLPYEPGEQDRLEECAKHAYENNTTTDDFGRNDYFSNFKGPNILDGGVEFWYMCMERLYDIDEATNDRIWKARREEIKKEILELEPRAWDFEFGFVKQTGYDASDLRAFDLLLDEESSDKNTATGNINKKPRLDKLHQQLELRF